MAIAGFSRVGVIGAGQMGSGIAQVCATHGMSVILVDSRPEATQNARVGIEVSAEKLANKGKISSVQKSQVQNQITYGQGLSLLDGADLIIEAIVENEMAKVDLFLAVSQIVGPKTIFASNTSSISITRMAAKTDRSERFIGMHFMNPVPIMQLVEIIPGMQTSPEVLRRVMELAQSLGKETVQSRDFPGFIVNRVLMPMINEAFTALMEGVACAEDIDKGMKLGTNQPMGPLALADFIGLDTCLSIMRVLFQGLGDPRYRPSPLLIQYVEAGFLGKKVKRGVYCYD